MEPLRKLQEWIDQAVGARIKLRARLVGNLDDSALVREVQVAAAGVRWESRRRLFGSGRPRPRWGVLQEAAELETVARTRAGARTL